MKSPDLSSLSHIALDGDLTIYTVAEQRVKLMDAIATRMDIDVDLSAVVEIDSAGLQLMVAAKRHAIAVGKYLRYINYSDPILGTLDLCDLESYFGDPVMVFSAARKSDNQDSAE